MPATGMILRALLIPFAGLAAAAACADQTTSHWTFGSQLGQVRAKGTPAAPPPADVSTMSYDVAATFGDNNRLGWRVFTGYRFTDYLAVHVGYTDLGKVQSRWVQEALASFTDPDVVATQSVHGVDVGLQLKMPLTERIAVELRGGKYYWKSRTRIALPMSEVESSIRRDADNFFGAGLEVGVVEDLSATLGWTRYEVAGEPIALWTVGVLYGFGFF